ncbi:MAG: hypothetical protein MI923_26490 [Phycisphaerales bacterium]|nr:hypothetical protein [Phycisphaerales bacterium]
MDTLTVDVGSKYVGLCKWDGRSLHAERQPTGSPVTCWSGWIEALKPSEPYQLLFYSTHSGSSKMPATDDVARLARDHGAHWVRVIAEDVATDPALAAARYLAGRHRLSIIAVAEIGAQHATLAVQDARGGLLAFERCTFKAGLHEDLPGVAQSLQSLLYQAASMSKPIDLHQIPLICFGGAGPEVAVRLAQDCDLKTILIPDDAGVFTAVGLLMTDIVMRFREQVKPAPLHLPDLRRAFGQLMDRVCTSVTMEGYDLDDTVCERVAEMSCTGDAEAIDVACDNLADESQLVARFQEGRTTKIGRDDEASSIEVRAVRVHATIETLKPELPVPPSADGKLDDAVLNVGDVRRSDVLRDAPVYGRDKFPVDVEVNGPALVQERYTTTVIPSGWSVRLSPAGGLWLFDEQFSQLRRRGSD